MGEIDFLYISLGNSTIQHHDRLGSRRAFACSVARFVVKIMTVLEGCITEYQLYVARLYDQKDPLQRVFIKNISGLRWEVFVAKNSSRLTREILSRTFESWRWCSTRSPSWDCDRSNCAAGGTVDSSWQVYNDRHFSNCTRVFPRFSIEHIAWFFKFCKACALCVPRELKDW
jgi:hypothetical protein